MIPDVSRFALALTVTLSWSVPSTLPAQSPYQVTIDNDYFAYWLPRQARPDREYTSGVILHFPLDTISPALQALTGALLACAEPKRRPRLRPCATARTTVGQKIYTPTAWRPAAGERPYAGWLYGSLDLTRATADRRREIGVEVGFTGRPSLGETVQSAVHRKLGHGSPIGWDGQVAFEPAFVVRGSESRVLAASPPGGTLGVLTTGGAGAAVGTAYTGAHASLELRAGVRPPHPWRDPPVGGVSLYVVAGVSQHLVLRNLTLDGNTFRPSSRVGHRLLFAEGTAGVGVRLGRFGLEYRGVVRGREYATQQRPHPYGSLSLSLARRSAVARNGAL
jgi:hypothetical protein